MITFSDNIARKPYLGSTEIAEVWLGNVLIYPEGTVDYSKQYFAIESLEDDNAIMFKLSSNSGSPSASSAKTISVSTDDGGTWTDYTSTKDGTTIATLNMGQKVLIRGNNNTYAGSGFRRSFSCFTASKQIDVNGNIMSLIYGDNFKEQYSFPSGTNYNFYNIFNSAPIVSAENLILPATTLTAYCYGSMFRGCTSLTTAPELPAETFENYCYDSMFRGCTSLTTAPELPATTLAQYCYYFMFQGCTSLTTAPELPATTLATACYNSMFQDCTSLTTAPELPATTLATYCYNNMFRGCTGLTTAPELPATTLASSCYAYMFYGTNVLPDCSNIDFTSNSVVSSGGLTGLFAGTKVTDSDLDRLLPKNTNGKYCLPAKTLASNCYEGMFSGCKSLVNAPELPATTLANSCYSNMFNGCTSLTTAPELPATTLSMYCYRSMFRGCTSLVTAPTLPATTLANYCYISMFQNCTALTTAPELPATTLASECYEDMFNGCTGLTTAPSVLPATTLENKCYNQMFYGCTSLKTAPELPAKTLAMYCYYKMFYGCRSLNYIKAMFTTTPGKDYTGTWVDGVASSGTFVKNSKATWNVTGVNGIPTGWTVQKVSS